MGLPAPQLGVRWIGVDHPLRTFEAMACAKIADQFLAVISELRLNQAADYLEMAARLLRIKAQMLLPRRLGDDEWEDPRSERAVNLQKSSS